MPTPKECVLLPFALKWARQQANMSMSELALASGVSISYLHHLEYGQRRNPRWEKVKQLAQALAVDPTDLAVLVAPARAPRRATDSTSVPSRAALTTDGLLR